INGYSGTVTSQVAYAIALAQTVKNVPGGKGAGIFWWGTEYQHKNGVNEAGFNTASFFDSSGNLLPVADVFGAMATPVLLNANITGQSLIFQWPLSGAGMSLTMTTNLTATPIWLMVTNQILSTGTVYNTTVPLDAAPNRFFRLKSN
ncbi:MAG TPA: glycosyl hydrolase 53 family protein, partial [Verrucomicrobiae bacterium]|nr:glycosyl hydrolase 53 family protein [Verrucomicrobiae bacterium]